MVERLLRIGGFENLEAIIAERIHKRQPHKKIVLNDKQHRRF
nr:hypothetical protein [Siccirubricoccus sp. G192]